MNHEIRHFWKGVEFRPDSQDLRECEFARCGKIAAALDILHPGIPLDKLKHLLLWGVRAVLDDYRQDTLRVRGKVLKAGVELQIVDTWTRQRIAKPDWVRPVTTCTLPGILVIGHGFDRRYLGDADPNYELAINGIAL